MTVAELIEKLKEMPQDLPVQYLDYEQGPSDVERVQRSDEMTKLKSYRKAVWLS